MTLTELLTKASIVKVEQLIGKNTASRVGGLFQDLINYFNGKTNTWTTVTDPVDDTENTVKEGDRWITGGQEKVRVNGAWELLSFWKLDENGNLFTEKNVYSQKEISAFGAGADPGSIVTAMEQLVDVILTSPLSGQILVFDGTHWRNQPLSVTPDLSGYATIAYSNLNFALSEHVHSWGTITDKPLSFTPSAHAHIWNDITDKPTTFAPSAHDHSFASLTAKPTTLSGYGITDAITSTVFSAHTGNQNAEKHLTAQQLSDLLALINGPASFWKLDVNGNLYTDKNVYSTLEVSAYGAGSGGSSGTSYSRLDSWLSYDSSKSEWVLSALLGKDLDDRVSSLESGLSTTITETDPTVGSHIKAITATNITNWNNAYTNIHTHANKTIIDQLSQSNLDVLSKLSLVNGKLQISVDTYSTGELSAYGAGAGGSGSSYNRLDAWASYDTTKADWVLSALLGNDLNIRVIALEGGSATTVTITGAGNAITAISKSGATITATKGLTFSEVGHTHTKANITDFPTSMPASDVYDWAKASTKPGYVWSEIGNKPSVITNTTASFTTALETKLNGIATGAQVNVNADWNATSGDALILNKPTSMPASDVYAWAKASTKPSYTASEIVGLGSSYRWLTDAYIATWNAKEPAITKGATSQYFRGDMSLALFPTALPASDVYAWAKASTKPSYVWSEIGSKPTTLSGYGITDAYTKSQVDSSVNTKVSKSGDTMTGNLTMGVTTDIITNFKTWTKDSSKSLKSFLNKFDIDANGNLVVIGNLYSTGEVTAYSSGTGISGLKLMGDLDANGKSITGALQIYGGNAYLGNVGINPSLQWSYEGDENTMAEYNVLTGEYFYAGNQVKYGYDRLEVVGQVKASEFKFGNYSFKQSANGLSICFNGVEQAYITNTGQYVNS